MSPFHRAEMKQEQGIQDFILIRENTMRTVEAFVSDALDAAPIAPTHVKVIAVVAAGHCIYVIDYAIPGVFIPDMLRWHFATQARLGWVGGAQLFGLAIGLGTWLPNITNRQGCTITKSLSSTFGMMLAALYASLIMMFVIDKFGRKRTASSRFCAPAYSPTCSSIVME